MAHRGKGVCWRAIILLPFGIHYYRVVISQFKFVAERVFYQTTDVECGSNVALHILAVFSDILIKTWLIISMFSEATQCAVVVLISRLKARTVSLCTFNAFTYYQTSLDSNHS